MFGTGSVEAVRKHKHDATLLQPLGYELVEKDLVKQISIGLTFSRTDESINDNLSTIEEISELTELRMYPVEEDSSRRT